MENHAFELFNFYFSLPHRRSWTRFYLHYFDFFLRVHVATDERMKCEMWMQNERTAGEAINSYTISMRLAQTTDYDISLFGSWFVDVAHSSSKQRNNCMRIPKSNRRRGQIACDLYRGKIRKWHSENELLSLLISRISSSLRTVFDCNFMHRSAQCTLHTTIALNCHACDYVICDTVKSDKINDKSPNVIAHCC